MHAVPIYSERNLVGAVRRILRNGHLDMGLQVSFVDLPGRDRYALGHRAFLESNPHFSLEIPALDAQMEGRLLARGYLDRERILDHDPGRQRLLAVLVLEKVDRKARQDQARQNHANRPSRPSDFSLWRH